MYSIFCCRLLSGIQMVHEVDQADQAGAWKKEKATEKTKKPKWVTEKGWEAHKGGDDWEAHKDKGGEGWKAHTDKGGDSWEAPKDKGGE